MYCLLLLQMLLMTGFVLQGHKSKCMFISLNKLDSVLLIYIYAYYLFFSR